MLALMGHLNLKARTHPWHSDHAKAIAVSSIQPISIVYIIPANNQAHINYLDSDADCADGLVCYQRRSSFAGGLIPGCSIETHEFDGENFC